MNRIRPPSLGKRLVGACTALAVLSIGASAAAAPKAKPEIYGVWLGIGFGAEKVGDWQNTDWTPDPGKFLTPWGAAESKRLDNPQSSQADYCRPGAPTGGAQPWFPMQIAKADNQVMTMVEGSPVVRRIYTDGRPHPKDLGPTFQGHSIGHWEGDTLVVDTIGTKGGGRPLNGFVAGGVTAIRGDYEPRLPITDQLHLTERIRLVGKGDFLEVVVTLEDPKAYTRSFTRTSYLQRRPDLDLLEYYCGENPRPEVEGYTADKAP